MNGDTAATIAYGTGLLALAVAILWAAHRLSKPSEEEHTAAAGRRIGPDPLRLLEDLEAHLKAYGAQVADLYDTTQGDKR